VLGGRDKVSAEGWGELAYRFVDTTRFEDSRRALRKGPVRALGC
jgi:hypothetical protein